MNILSPEYTEEQNKIASSGAWIWLLGIYTVGQTPDTLRFTNNNADIVFPTVGGNTYLKMPFSMDDIIESTSGKFPEYTLQIGDVDLASTLRTRIKATSGLVGSSVRLMVVHSDHLTLATPAIDEIAEILSCEVTASAVLLSIGFPSMLSRRFPRDRYVPSFCRHKFGGALCRYVQPAYSRTTNNISFEAGDEEGDKDIRYSIIRISSGRLIEDVFSGAPGAYDRSYTPSRYRLTNNTGFLVSGSLYNDGWFLANSYHLVNQLWVKVFMEADGARPFVAEPAGKLITIQLGYDGCDHTLEACALRDNTQNYGGSPGIAGGMYG